jgi:hypothetical protein
MPKFPLNDGLFGQVRALNLPLGHYAITGSGPLGVRGVRQVNEIDMIVDDELWDKLALEHRIIKEDNFSRLCVGDDIEIMGEGSFMTQDIETITVNDQIADADIIDGLPFIKLKYLLHFKQIMNRPKDQADIKAIEKLLATEPKA